MLWSAVVIGDELLDGYVVDVNSRLLQTELRKVGCRLSEIRYVRDSVDAIGEAIGALVSRVDVVVSIGGIGPTPDDVTYLGVAEGLGYDVEVHSRLAEWCRQWAGDSAGLVASGAWREAARVPVGSYLLESSGVDGAVAAVDINGGAASEGATVVMLPGHPKWFELAVKSILVPTIMGGEIGRRDVSRCVFDIEHGVSEWRLADELWRVATRYPAVTIGSYCAGSPVLRVVGSRRVAESAASMLSEAIRDAQEKG